MTGNDANPVHRSAAAARRGTPVLSGREDGARPVCDRNYHIFRGCGYPRFQGNRADRHIGPGGGAV